MESNERTKLYTVPDESGALQVLKKNPKDMNEVLEFKYIQKRQISPDTYIYVYEIPNNLNLGLNIGQHIAIDADINTAECPEGEPVSRKYTPTSTINMRGRFEMLIKVYNKGVHSEYPEGGKMSQYLNDIPLGSNIRVRGPFGKLTYYGDGNVKILKKFKPLTFHEKKYKKIGMIAGGTGITPFFQIIQAAHLNKDLCEMSLIFCNRTIKDILLQEELDIIHKEQNFKFNIFYIISKNEEGWTGGIGHVTKDMILTYLPEASDDTLILTCGPPTMCQDYLLPILKNIGHKVDNIFDF